jgi:hypothetical protein
MGSNVLTLNILPECHFGRMSGTGVLRMDIHWDSPRPPRLVPTCAQNMPTAHVRECQRVIRTRTVIGTA